MSVAALWLTPSTQQRSGPRRIADEALHGGRRFQLQKSDECAVPQAAGSNARGDRSHLCRDCFARPANPPAEGAAYNDRPSRWRGNQFVAEMHIAHASPRLRVPAGRPRGIGNTGPWFTHPSADVSSQQNDHALGGLA
jgi:hypothetical protein